MGALKTGNESETGAAKYQTLQTKYHTTNTLQTKTGRKSRPCQQFAATTDHVIPTCLIVVK